MLCILYTQCILYIFLYASLLFLLQPIIILTPFLSTHIYRGIWPQYYHDIHAFIYVIDITNTHEEIINNINLLKTVCNHIYLKNKPYLIILNKIDLLPIETSTATINEITELITKELATTTNGKVGEANGVAGEVADTVHTQAPAATTTPTQTLHVCTCTGLLLPTSNPTLPPQTNTETGTDKRNPDMSLEQHIEQLITTIRHNYDHLQKQVENDTYTKLKEETLKRLEREKYVLKTKIALAFYRLINPILLSNTINKTTLEDPPVVVVTEKDQDLFTEEEALPFLSAEINATELDEGGRRVAMLVGYQRLALQIVGGMYAPINKHKAALSWAEIEGIVLEIRAQLGLPAL